MAAPSNCPITLFPKRWQGKTLGQSWPSSYACPEARLLPSPSLCDKTHAEPHHLTSCPEPTGAGCCGSARAIWELHYMASKAGPVLLVQGPWAHLSPGSDPAVWLPSVHLFPADCTGVKQAAWDQPGQAGVLLQEPGLWGRTEGKAQGSAACFLHHTYILPSPYHIHTAHS